MIVLRRLIAVSVLILLCALPSIAFSPFNSERRIGRPTTSRLRVIDPDAIGVARTDFYLWFFGASGGAGIARGSFPRMWNDFRAIQKMSNEPTKGGETIGISPLCLYPQDIPVKDIKAIVNSPLSVEKIVEKYPVEGNFLSAKGYLTYQAFSQANADKNPLAVRAVFDTLNTNSNVVDPDTARSKIASLKQDPRILASELLKAKLGGYASILSLLFLLALADWQAILVHGRAGFFPEWPGLDDFPNNFFDPDLGITALPKYFVGGDPNEYISKT